MREDSQIGEGEDQRPIHSMSNDFTKFEMKTLVAATENFHVKNTLGEGGFGVCIQGNIR